MNELTNEQLLRYSRHILLKEIDIKGQQTLLQKKVLIVGLGGIGCPASLYLASSGIGTLHLLDFDTVELSNLQRQIIHTENQINQYKTKSAKQLLQEINSDIVIKITNSKDKKKLNTLIQQADIVLDGTDNFNSRFTIHDYCLKNKTPLVSASVIQYHGQLALFKGYQKNKPCYHCLYDKQNATNDDTCSNNGVLAPVAGVLGTLAATLVIKSLLKLGKQLDKELLLFDAMDMTTRIITLNKDPKCHYCQNL